VLNEREKLTWLASASPLTNMPMPKRTTCRRGIGFFGGVVSDIAGRAEMGGGSANKAAETAISEACSGLEASGLRQKVRAWSATTPGWCVWALVGEVSGGDHAHLHFSELAFQTVFLPR
jgi:hypothetical protein